MLNEKQIEYFNTLCNMHGVDNMQEAINKMAEQAKVDKEVIIKIIQEEIEC